MKEGQVKSIRYIKKHFICLDANANPAVYRSKDWNFYTTAFPTQEQCYIRKYT